MGFETERSDEAGRCGLGDWELGSAEAGRRRRPTELATGTDRTGFAKREQPNWPFWGSAFWGAFGAIISRFKRVRR